jgi:hypothetical protein
MKAFIQRALLVSAAILSGCGGAAAWSTPTIPSTTATATPAATSTSLPRGDGKYASAPATGSVYLCSGMLMTGGPATSASLPWLNGDGTYDPAKKIAVQGSVSWPSQLSITVSGNTRTISGNGLPSHATGTFPIASTDPAYAYGPNPNAISAQSISLSLPANPAVAQTPSCVGMGAVGVMLTGAVFFNAFDAQGNDANAHETQDACAGHPQQSGMYHYHRLSPCSADSGTGHSSLVGYALDGFGIYGPRGEGGERLTDADLDECHGHTHAITWDGKTVTMYHYHATDEFPYTIGCYRGTPVAAPR